MLGVGLAPAWAQPPEGTGPGHVPGLQREQRMHGDNRGESFRGEHRDRHENDRYGDGRRDRDRHENDRYGDGWRDRDRRDHGWRGPRLDEAALRVIFREHRDWIGYDRRRDALPPGIRMNLRRGKPLPPGIARRFDPRLRERLPYYEGYEWRRVGDNAVLIDIATRHLHFILEGIL
ncbi:hypothetical protein C7H85_18990 [Zobellella endophytica]|uniref:Nickel/cobalt transporter regulator n=2 Tax=Zobellella endophytica TaxID=2116700 RepID=A0A2P7QQU6_9GAMM|nr:hypothetical protein C7H85_18990 [Zobellella endophytica]